MWIKGDILTKVELVDAIQAVSGMTKLEGGEVLEALLEIIKDTLAEGEDIKIAGFGKFAVKEKSDRRGRNPQTGEQITIKARRILTYQASAMLKKRING
jgi:integration host factor subunit alpha